MNIETLDVRVLTGFADYDAHEKIVRIRDMESGLHALIGVHNTRLGPGLGGCRMLPYADEAAAMRDVLRLSRGMTYKNALAGLPLGGGKAVIIGDPYTYKTPALIAAMGRAVQALEGMYITAEDSGTSEDDMAIMAAQTSYVTGLHDSTGGVGGNPSPVTAYGVYCGLKAAVRHRLGRDGFAGLTVAVQGLGAVGYALCRLLDADGAALVVADLRPSVLARAQDEFSMVTVVDGDAIFTTPADIFAPCALGAPLNAQTIPVLSAKIVGGAANNQLATPGDALALAQRGILYVPDYLINAGGVMTVGYEYFSRRGQNPFSHPLDHASLKRQVEGIGVTLNRVLNLADMRRVTPAQAADALAESLFSEPQRATG